MKADKLSCLFCEHAKTGVFCALEHAALQRLDAGKSIYQYGSGNVLYYEGGAPLAIYCVHDGLLKLTKSTPEGRSVVIRLLGKGEIVGFRAVIADEPYAATAEVVEPSAVCIIPADTFRALLEQSLTFKNTLINKLATELRISEERMVDQLVLPARVRIARLLLFLAEQTTPGSDRLIVPARLPRQDLAEAAGVTPQTFSRILHMFNVEGIVRSSRTQLTITALNRLKILASHKR
jgi:CRP/FNR family transcriptional regulator